MWVSSFGVRKSLAGFLFKMQTSDLVGRAFDSKTRVRAQQYAF